LNFFDSTKDIFLLCGKTENEIDLLKAGHPIDQSDHAS